MEKENYTFEPFRVVIPESYFQSMEKRRRGFFEWIDNWFTESVIVPIKYNKRRVCHVTGMSYTELNAFLESHKFESNGKYISYEALEAIEKWYVKKLKRYVKNALSTDLQSEDKATFLDFCRKFRKSGIKGVKSWKDIDEDLILAEFRTDCDGSAPCLSPLFGQDGPKSLLAKIYTSYLFHTRFKATKHRRIVLSLLAFFISHHYHIFTTEADANADATFIVAPVLIKQWFNPPRRTILYGLAS